MGIRHITVIIVALSTAFVLAGCSNASSDTPAAPMNTPDATATASAAPVVAAPMFTMPGGCTDTLPESRLNMFDGEGLILLGGPGGRYENDYLLEPSPEERLGGITCIWGYSDSEISTITVSVAPLNPQNRAAVVDSFISEGLNQSEVDGATLFTLQGDTRTEPAIINSLRADSWISVIATLGGTASYENALQVVAETTTAVYVAR
jgi:hypothetical protein